MPHLRTEALRCRRRRPVLPGCFRGAAGERCDQRGLRNARERGSHQERRRQGAHEVVGHEPAFHCLELQPHGRSGAAAVSLGPAGGAAAQRQLVVVIGTRSPAAREGDRTQTAQKSRVPGKSMALDARALAAPHGRLLPEVGSARTGAVGRYAGVGPLRHSVGRGAKKPSIACAGPKASLPSHERGSLPLG